MASILEMVNDPKVDRLLMVGEIATILIKVTKRMENDGSVTVADLKYFAKKLEREIYKHCSTKYEWRENEPPLRVEFTFIQGKVHVDLNGPLSYEVAIQMESFLTFDEMPELKIGEEAKAPSEELKADDLDDEGRGLNPGFKYGQ